MLLTVSLLSHALGPASNACGDVNHLGDMGNDGNVYHLMPIDDNRVYAKSCVGLINRRGEVGMGSSRVRPGAYPSSLIPEKCHSERVVDRCCRPGRSCRILRAEGLHAKPPAIGAFRKGMQIHACDLVQVLDDKAGRARHGRRHRSAVAFSLISA